MADRTFRFGPLLLLVIASGCGSVESTRHLAGEADAVRYQVTFVGEWNAEQHPELFPRNAHFSGLIGAVHREPGLLWQVGELASPGIEQMAETGRKNELAREIEEAIEAEEAGDLLSGPGIGSSPGEATLAFHATPAHSRLSLVSMIAPSPDWFVGVDGLSLHDGSDWRSELNIELYAYDAGTERGEAFALNNLATDPEWPIAALADPPAADVLYGRLEIRLE